LNLTLLTSEVDLAVKGLDSIGIKGVVDGKQVRALVPTGQIEAKQIVKTLVDLGVGVNGFTLESPTLEERFVLLTGEGFDVAR
jgi:ABC-2 type transport system ATP-binding protein